MSHIFPIIYFCCTAPWLSVYTPILKGQNAVHYFVHYKSKTEDMEGNNWKTEKICYITDICICNTILSLHPLLIKLKQDNKHIYIYTGEWTGVLKRINSMLILTFLTLSPNCGPILHVPMKGCST